jgi:hypothetical protein
MRTPDGAMRVLVAALALAASAANSAAAAPPVEFWGGLVAVGSASGATASDFSPPLLLDGDFTSHAAQRLAIDVPVDPGFEGGVNLFPSTHVGVQFLVDYASRRFTGANGPYAYSLHYVSHQPPNNEAVPVDIAQSVPWPDTSGSLTEVVAAANVVARFGSRRIAGAVSAGPALRRVALSMQPLGYTSFHLGGHSVLFEDDYRLAAAVAPTYTLGFDVGANVTVGVARHVAVLAGYRYFGFADVDAPTSAASILNPDQLFTPQPLSDIQSALGSTRTRVSPGASRFIVGLEIR